MRCTLFRALLCLNGQYIEQALPGLGRQMAIEGTEKILTMLSVVFGVAFTVIWMDADGRLGVMDDFPLPRDVPCVPCLLLLNVRNQHWMALEYLLEPEKQIWTCCVLRRPPSSGGVLQRSVRW